MTVQKDLFGNEYKLEDVKLPKGPVQKLKAKIGYHKTKSKKICCKTCLNLIIKRYSRTYYNCQIIGCTNGPATDVRLSYVCKLWKCEDGK